MTTTTVEVPRTVTEEEELHLCDECHREVDGNSREFLPRKGGSGTSLHFCSECLNEMTDGEIQPAHIERVEEWLNTSWEDHINKGTTVKTLEGQVKGAAGFSSWAAGIGILLGIGFVIASVVGISLPLGGLFPVLYGIGAALALMFNALAMEDAGNAIDKANESVK